MGHRNWILIVDKAFPEQNAAGMEYIYACRKDISLLVNGREAASGSLLENAKIWRLQNLKKGTLVLKPLWQDSWKITSKNNKELLVVPAPEHYISDENYRIRRFFIFSVSDNNISNGQIVEFFGANYKIEDNLDHLLKNYDETTIDKFNGAVNKYDINYIFLNNHTFENGKLSKKNIRLAMASVSSIKSDLLSSAKFKGRYMFLSPNKLMGLSAGKAMTANDCGEPVVINEGFPASYCEGGTVHIQEETTYADGCLISLKRKFLGVSCPETSGNGGGSGSGSGSGSGADENPPYGNSVFTYERTLVVEVVDPVDPAAEAEEAAATGVGTRNPAGVNFYADVKAVAYIGGGTTVAYIDEVRSMHASLVNGNQTTYLPDGTEDSWHNVLSSTPIYNHGLVGFPTISLRWRTSRVTRHTVKKPGEVTKETIRTTPYDVSRTYSAYLNAYIN